MKVEKAEAVIFHLKQRKELRNLIEQKALLIEEIERQMKATRKLVMTNAEIANQVGCSIYYVNQLSAGKGW